MSKGTDRLRECIPQHDDTISYLGGQLQSKNRQQQALIRIRKTATLIHCRWECKVYRHFGIHFGNSL
jgi:hypothetical protein